MARKRIQIHMTIEGPHPPLEVEFDPAIRAVYVKLRDDPVDKTIEIDEGVHADVNAKGELVGIEFLKPTRVRVLDQLARKFRRPEIRSISKVGDLGGMLIPA